MAFKLTLALALVAVAAAAAVSVPQKPGKPVKPVKPKPGQCMDLSNDIVDKYFRDDIQSCKELVDAVLGDGGTCTTDIQKMLDPKFVKPSKPGSKGKTINDVCCKSCGGAKTNPDKTQLLCKKEHSTCLMDALKWNFACASSGSCNPKDLGTKDCLSCTMKTFGQDYKLCSCCMAPIFADAEPNFNLDDLDKIFPCAAPSEDVEAVLARL